MGTEDADARRIAQEMQVLVDAAMARAHQAIAGGAPGIDAADVAILLLHIDRITGSRDRWHALAEKAMRMLEQVTGTARPMVVPVPPDRDGARPTYIAVDEIEAYTQDPRTGITPVEDRSEQVAAWRVDDRTWSWIGQRLGMPARDAARLYGPYGGPS